MRQKSIIVLLLAMVLAIPVGAATWAGRGFYEPDTQHDRTDGSMWAEAPGTATNRVYFNAYVTRSDPLGSTNVNPNLAVVKSNHIAYPYTTFNALLGVWTDCNGDGYIGTIEGALYAYRAELGGGICAPGQSPHNDGAWVYELLPIGPGNPAACSDPAMNPDYDPETDPSVSNEDVILDQCARIWGDIGLPEDAGVVTCPLNPLPRRTLESTGGMQRYADCIAGGQIYGATSQLAPLDGTGGFQFSQTDTTKERPDQSQSILNQRNPYGVEGDPTAVSVFDCSAPGTPIYDDTGMLKHIAVTDPTGAAPREVANPFNPEGEPIALTDSDGEYADFNGTDEDGRIATVHGTGAPGVNPAGSPAGTVNETLETTPDFGFNGAENEVVSLNPWNKDGFSDGDCDRESGIGQNSDVYEAAETDFEPATPLRRNHDFSLIFYEGGYGTGITQVDSALGEKSPQDGGSGFLRDTLVSTDPLWYGNVIYTASRNGFLSLDTYGPQKTQTFTFYAHVHGGVLSSNGFVTPSGTFVYGAEHCNGSAATTGLWDCDGDNWWKDPTGTDIKSDWQVRVGQAYQLRDVECFDETYFEGQPTTYTELTSGTICAR